MNWHSLLLAGASGVALALAPPASSQTTPWFPPTPRNGLVDEIGALSEAEAAQLRGMLGDAVPRDDVRLVVLILKEAPPVPAEQLIRAVLARQKRCWLRALVCVSADSTAPPLVGCDGPGMADFPAERLRQMLAIVRENASTETALGPQILRYSADLLDEIHRQRMSDPDAVTTRAGPSMAWVVRHPTLTVALGVGGLVLLAAGLRGWWRKPQALRFPVAPMAARLGGPYTGGSRVAVDFDAATATRSRERVRK